MIQLHSASKSSLRKQSDLRNNELIDLFGLILLVSPRPLLKRHASKHGLPLSARAASLWITDLNVKGVSLLGEYEGGNASIAIRCPRRALLRSPNKHAR
jgi:hypothetical protein